MSSASLYGLNGRQDFFLDMGSPLKVREKRSALSPGYAAVAQPGQSGVPTSKRLKPLPSPGAANRRSCLIGVADTDAGLNPARRFFADRRSGGSYSVIQREEWEGIPLGRVSDLTGGTRFFTMSYDDMIEDLASSSAEEQTRKLVELLDIESKA